MGVTGARDGCHADAMDIRADTFDPAGRRHSGEGD
jgi:hypothetical protein